MRNMLLGIDCAREVSPALFSWSEDGQLVEMTFDWTAELEAWLLARRDDGSTMIWQNWFDDEVKTRQRVLRCTSVRVAEEVGDASKRSLLVRFSKPLDS